MDLNTAQGYDFAILRAKTLEDENTVDKLEHSFNYLIESAKNIETLEDPLLLRQSSRTKKLAAFLEPIPEYSSVNEFYITLYHEILIQCPI